MLDLQLFRSTPIFFLPSAFYAGKYLPMSNLHFAFYAESVNHRYVIFLLPFMLVYM